MFNDEVQQMPRIRMAPKTSRNTANGNSVIMQRMTSNTEGQPNTAEAMSGGSTLTSNLGRSLKISGVTVSKQLQFRSKSQCKGTGGV